MTPRLKIVVAEDEAVSRDFLEESLRRLGHEVVGHASTGQELVEVCRTVRPDLVITDIKMPDMDGLEAARQIGAEFPVPIVIVSAHANEEFVARAQEQQVLAFLVKPIKPTDLGPAIAIAMGRFREFQALHQEADDLRQALEDRKLIERAKGLLMKQARLDEPTAFRRLQSMARNNNLRLVEVARMVVTTATALSPEGELP